MIPHFDSVTFTSETSSVTQTQTIVLASQKIYGYLLNNGIGQASGSTNLSWDDKLWQVSQAMLNFSGTQTSGNGADVTLTLNGAQVDRLNWGIFDTGTSSNTRDVTSNVANGMNSWALEYDIAFLPPPGANDYANVTATIEFTLNYIGTGTVPPTPPITATQNGSPFALPWWVEPAAIGLGAIIVLVLIDKATHGAVRQTTSDLGRATGRAAEILILK